MQLELVDPNEVVSESIALVRQERVLEEAFRCRSHHDQEDSKDQDEDEDVPHGLNGVVFDEATLHLIQKEFNTFQKDKNGSIRCGYLRRILLSLEMYVSDTKIQNLLEEIGATEDTLISFAECVDILSLLAESQLTIEEEEQREVKEKDEEED
jgi:Ca2+-binding EF-hand superfamily protein